ncbi:hypothetical protein [Pseudonocardia spinosispora]|uniref:hypothetical protein n=1 Tax=Pseudonocardia spinosispora TaxID=103441 RepID=UPI0003FDB83B|nr:hypothetical protein [Pseudonocardia spinosispora]
MRKFGQRVAVVAATAALGTAAFSGIAMAGTHGGAHNDSDGGNSRATTTVECNIFVGGSNGSSTKVGADQCEDIGSHSSGGDGVDNH